MKYTNNYIYNIKHILDNYMFHDKELIVNDIVWAYEPKGKRKTGYCLGNCEDCVSAKWGCNGWEQDEPSIYGCERGLISYHPDYENLYEGTGKVIAKYKVVEVYKHYEEYEKSPYINAKVSYRTRRQTGVIEFDMNEENNRTYAYKLEKIEDVSMELSEFYVASKYNKFLNDNFTEEELETMFALCLPKELVKYFTLTRYNGRLVKVIPIANKEE